MSPMSDMQVRVKAEILENEVVTTRRSADELCCAELVVLLSKLLRGGWLAPYCIWQPALS